jgi:hypothetical protein
VTTDTNEDFSPTTRVRARWAIALFEKHLGFMSHPDGAIIRLVQFAHDSPGLRKYKRQVCEAMVYTLESNGGYVLNGLTEAVAVLEHAGYTITPPSPHWSAQGNTEPQPTEAGLRQ